MKRILSVFLALTLFASSAYASVITAPSELNPGDTYRLAFVTSTTSDALSTNIADYNTFVTNVANTAPELLALNTTWTAIASTASVDARDNTDTNPNVAVGVPIYLLNGPKLANDNSDLWDGSIGSLPYITEQGTGKLGYGVWTGTNASGIKQQPLGTTPNTIIGVTNSTSATWMLRGASPPATQYQLYAISQTLTIASVPIPATVWLFGSGLLGLVGIARRKKSA